jgi:hypothetical protein
MVVEWPDEKEEAADRGGPATSAQSPVRCAVVSSPMTMTV